MKNQRRGPEVPLKRTRVLGELGIPEPGDADCSRLFCSIKQAAEQQIDLFLREQGCSDCADEQGWRYFSKGSAGGRAGILILEDEIFLRVEALIMPLPSDHDLILPLMRELLEFNMLPGLTSLGITNGDVYAVGTQPVAKLRTKDDFARCIDLVVSVADGLDDYLKDKYGGTTRRRVGVN